ncbi:MAG TPA: methyltransferase domain-containing protein, partial [Longimicrobiaceae bacterium]|nr:methyltransferase domain-containing protein [Longimicrobiaceae bacterium]
MSGTDLRFAMQDRAYAFPYHYLPGVDEGAVTVSRTLGWGLEYLTYMHLVRDAVAELRPQRLLDVGCGDGRMLEMLRGVVPVRVGVDPSERAIRFAQAFNPDAECVVGTAADVPGTFDVVTCVETLEHIPDAVLASFVAALAGKLGPGGVLVASV